MLAIFDFNHDDSDTGYCNGVHDDFNCRVDCYDDHHSGSLRSEGEETNDDYVSEMCLYLSLFG